MNDDPKDGAYRIWAKLINGEIQQHQALDELLQLLAGLLSPEDIA